MKIEVTKEDIEKGVLAVAYGGGVNSMAMLIGMRDRGLCPDIITFADTGGERYGTYDSINRMQEWCSKYEFPPITTVRYTDNPKHRLDRTLEDECLRLGVMPSLAYGWKTCSQKWKQAPQNYYLERHSKCQAAWDRGEKVVKAIGYDAGEDRRAKDFVDDKYAFWFPLREWGLDRDDCEELCARERLPVAKSSCFFCPATKKGEILDLQKTAPELMERALAIEDGSKEKSKTSVGLGRRFNWREFLSKGGACQLPQMEAETEEVPCGCYDG